jgi:signal peptide peptidase SppA
VTTVAGAGAAQAADGKVAEMQESLVNGAGGVVTGLQQLTEPIMSGLGAFMSDPTVREIGLSLANTLIAWAVPVGAGLAIVGSMSGPKGGDEESKVPSSLADLFKKPGGVTEYLKIERLNDQLESYGYSITKALKSERQAKLEKQRASFARTYGTTFASQLNESQLKKLSDADKKFQGQVCKLRNKSDGITRELRALAAKSVSETAGGPMKMMGGGPESALQKEQLEVAKRYSAAEIEYIKTVSKELPKDSREDFSKLLKTSRIGLQQQDEGSPFLSAEEPPSEKAHIWCLNFKGDIAARQVDSLRQEVTAIIRAANATRSDEVVLRLSSPGGTVTGYGSAAAQLVRIKYAGLKLTICVEEVAASGGYMMACVADHLVASPMAVLGSIGVIQELPNAYERLTKEGLQFITVTAGQYKRTLTPFKKPNKEDEAKLKEDIGMVWSEFKSFVQDQRPALDVEKYGTGETWYGNEALKRNLCDEIANSDDVILNKLDKGAEIYGVKYMNPKRNMIGGVALPSGQQLSDFSTVRNLLGRLLLGESLADIAVEPPRLDRQVMAIDRTAKNTFLMDEQ